MSDKKKLTGIYFTKEMLIRLKTYAAQKLVSVSEVVERAVKEFLDREENKK